MSTDEPQDEIPDGLEDVVFETALPAAKPQLPQSDPIILALQQSSTLAKDMVAWRALATRMAGMKKELDALILSGKPVSQANLPALPHLELNVPVNGAHQPEEPLNGRTARVGIAMRNVDRLTPEEIGILLTIMYNYGVRSFQAKKLEYDTLFRGLTPEKLEIRP